MKRLIKSLAIMFLITMTSFVLAQPSTPKPKRIFITLDVSGSMEGNKYVMANYVAQTISVFCDEGDLVFVYYLGTKHDITGTNGYRRLHIPFGNHSRSGGSTYYEISDLTQFLKDYRPNEGFQDWLFIIGDGFWKWGRGAEEYDRTTLKFKETVEGGDLQVCYLQTGDSLNQSSEFTRFLEEQNAPTIEIRKSDTTASSVLENCVGFANRILGFSDYPIQMQQASPSCLAFKSEFPLEKFLLTYQSSQISSDIKVESAGIEGLSIASKVKGNPSTKPLIAPGRPALNGMVWELGCSQTIPANEEVKVCFNQDIDIRRFVLYPYVDVNLHVQPWSVDMDTLSEPSADHFLICDKDDKVLIKMSATDKNGNKFPPPLMRRMEVLLVAGNESHQGRYNEADTTFVVMLPLTEDEVTYHAKVESAGYFSRVTGLQYIRKSASVCPPERVPMITIPVQIFEPISFKALKNEERFDGRIKDSLFLGIAASGTFEEVAFSGHDSWMLEDANFTMEDGGIVSITQHPVSGLCECAFPDTLQYEVVLRSNQGLLYEGKQYEGFIIPILVPVEKRDWWNRCWLYVALLGGLLLFLLYLLAMRKKRRFGKEAKICARKIDIRYGTEVDKHYNQYLRKKTFGSWLLRWTWPKDERNTLTFINPRVSMHFIAGENTSSIEIPSERINNKIQVGGYIPRQGQKPPKYLRLANNEKIVINKNETTKEGTLQYVSGDKTDEGLFRILNMLLIFATIAAEIFVIWTLIDSLL